MAGILQSMPSVFSGAFKSFITAGTYANWLGILLFVLFILVYVLIIVGIIWITLAERRIAIQYANHTTSAYGAKSSYLPIKINSAGVMPVIFASIILTIPVTIAGLIGKQSLVDFMNKYIVYTSPTGFILYKDLNKRGGYIPGIRPGKDTTEYVSKSLSKLTLVGSIFLVILAGIPIIFSNVSGLPSSITIGGTGILIVVGVAIETYKQIESGLVSRNYGRKRKLK